MASKASIQTVRAEFLDPTLYDDAGLSGVPRLSKGTILTAFSRALDLAEGRRSGHAQRVAYVGSFLAEDLGLPAAQIEEVFFACLLHDVGMATMRSVGRIEPSRGARVIANSATAKEILGSMPSGGWNDVIEALTLHCEAGAKIVRRLGLSENVALAVSTHHDCWDATSGPLGVTSIVSRIVAAADRVESMIDADASPLMVRRRGPQLVQEMSGHEIDPEIAARLVGLASRDEFWLGLYDNDLSSALMAPNYGGMLGREDLFNFLGVISDVVDSRNGREMGRGRRVADIARTVALGCDMTERRADLVKVATLLQDIGTLGIPASVLAKPDILTIDEMSTVQLHPTFARDILSEIPGFGAAAWWVGCHHERIDGKGYPGMLEGDEVPIEAQIIGLSEAFDALTSDRPYRRAMAPADAMTVMKGLAGTRFDGYLLGRFESVVGLSQA